MLTIKNPVKFFLVFFLAAPGLLTGCKPSGPDALLDGQRYLEKGDLPRAVARLRLATELLRTNAHAWNYLGLAYHHSGDVSNAVSAYKRALSHNPDLSEAYFNLGCLHIEQDRPDLAKEPLTAFTLHNEDSPDGWLKLGSAQVKLREFSAADKSLNQALKLRPADAEVLNELGLLHLARNRPADAAQTFSAALKSNPNYPPAILNLAVTAHSRLNNRSLALEKYQQYLSLNPRPANWDSVAATVREMQQPSKPATRPAPTNSVASVPAANPPPPPPMSAPPKPEPTVAPVVRATQHVSTAAGPPAAAASLPVRTAEVVRVAPEPVLKPGHDVSSQPLQSPNTATQQSSAVPTARADEAERRGFLQKMNPANIFTRDQREDPRPTPLPDAAVGSTSTTASVSSGATVDPYAAVSSSGIRRYAYRNPSAPRQRNRSAAERAFAQGVQAQRGEHLPEAMLSYRQAIEQDPSFFDAHYNLGVASTQAGNLQQALIAYENALAIRPQSLDARYNFALVLKQSRYPLDAANELEKILQNYPQDARAHLALGNLCAYELGLKDKAREHYLKVLQNDPQNSQAGAIRYWLAENPR